MSARHRLFLSDILQACAKVRRYSADLSLEHFVSDSRTFDAVLHNLAIIGEAAKQIPPEIRALAPEIEWRKIARFRDIVIHHYFAVDEQIVWDIATTKVPELQAQIGRLMPLLPEEPSPNT